MTLNIPMTLTFITDVKRAENTSHLQVLFLVFDNYIMNVSPCLELCVFLTQNEKKM